MKVSDLEIILSCSEYSCNSCIDRVITVNNQLELISKLTELIAEFTQYDCSVRLKI